MIKIYEIGSYLFIVFLWEFMVYDSDIGFLHQIVNFLYLYIFFFLYRS